MDSLASDTAMMLLASSLSAIGAGIIAAFTVGGKIASKMADKINDHAIKIAELEIRVSNGVTESLREIKVDIKKLIAESALRPCQRHADLLEGLVARVERMEGPE